MRRVLRRGAPVAVATWKDIEHSPFVVVADSLAAHLGREAGDMMRSPFALSDPDELRRLVVAAGFTDVLVTEETIECTWSTQADFARQAIAAGPIAQRFSDAPNEAQRAVAEDVADRLEPHATADGRLRMLMTTNIAVARA